MSIGIAEIAFEALGENALRDVSRRDRLTEPMKQADNSSGAYAAAIKCSPILGNEINAASES